MYMYIRGRLYYVFNREIDFVFAIPPEPFATNRFVKHVGFGKSFIMLTSPDAGRRLRLAEQQQLQRSPRRVTTSPGSL